MKRSLPNENRKNPLVHKTFLTPFLPSLAIIIQLVSEKIKMPKVNNETMMTEDGIKSDDRQARTIN
jgi:hypothetical protein